MSLYDDVGGAPTFERLVHAFYEGVAADPELRALYETRERLERQISALRARRASMDSVAYETELERLLVELAETNQQIRRLEGGREP